MSKLQIFDPPMCCSTGVCGPAIDPKLARFAADLEWLKSHGVEVQRFNLSQEPGAFVENPVVAAAMRGQSDALPLILVDGEVAFKGSYPERETLASKLGVGAPKSIYSEAVQELVAIGAAIASNCEPCFRSHYDKARKLGVSKEDMARAVATAKMVKAAPAKAVLELAERYLDGEIKSEPPSKACCSATTQEIAGAPSKPAIGSKCC